MRLTPTQRKAISDLKTIPRDHWKGYDGGMGKYRIALRALVWRAPDMIETKIENNNEFWRLTDIGLFIECPGDHRGQCCGHFDDCAKTL